MAGLDWWPLLTEKIMPTKLRICFFRAVIGGIAVIAALASLAEPISAKVFQRRGLPLNSWFASMPGANRLYEGPLRINNRDGHAEVWTMQAGLRRALARVYAVLNGDAQALHVPNNVDGLILRAQPGTGGLLVLETGLPGQTVGMLLKTSDVVRIEPSREGAVLAQACNAVECVFDAESGKTRLEIMEVAVGVSDALAIADSALRGLGWLPAACQTGTDMQIWLRGREVCLIRAAKDPDSGCVRMSLLTSSSGRGLFKE